MPLLDNDRHPNVSLLMSVECHVDTRRTAFQRGLDYQENEIREWMKILSIALSTISLPMLDHRDY